MTYIDNEGMSLLQEGISEARSVLREHDRYLSGNETRTRTLVIDRVLAALGWGVTDPGRVLLEHRANGNKIDYVLLSSNQEFRAVVEAKPADAGPKESDRRQASGYATEIGAQYSVLTNGGRWEAWRMARTPRKENIIVEAHLTTGEIAKVASDLIKLHRDVLGQYD